MSSFPEFDEFQMFDEVLFGDNVNVLGLSYYIYHMLDNSVFDETCLMFRNISLEILGKKLETVGYNFEEDNHSNSTEMF